MPWLAHHSPLPFHRPACGKEPRRPPGCGEDVYQKDGIEERKVPGKPSVEGEEKPGGEHEKAGEPEDKPGGFETGGQPQGRGNGQEERYRYANRGGYQNRLVFPEVIVDVFGQAHDGA
ncbi:hypothetical protein SDC9_05421 [bioreactor metagenome]|uniref:Uncharacterized protein n=1 Tax=bioreactor metagenome TaxID=1076179 RepID=A0A644SZ13_9ZZZZ